MKTLISTLKNGKADFFALLSKRMDEKGDFPAFSKSVQLLEESIHSNTRNITDITNAILNNELLASITSTQKLANEPIPKSTIEQPKGKPKNSHETLTTGIKEIKVLLAQGISFNSALSIILETIYSSMGFNRVCAFLRDAGMFKAKIGYGNGMPEMLPQLVFPAVYSADVFHLSLSNKADVFIEEVSTVKESSSIPVWHRKTLPDAAAFILLPLVSNNNVVGLIYADWGIGTNEIVEHSELTSMGALRDNLTKLLANGS
jgi:hypothetical protein